jgi:valyl-tRNA synthetase
LFSFAVKRFETLNYKTSVANTSSTLLINELKDRLSLVDLYILSRLADTVSRAQDAFTTLRLHQATAAIRKFIWEDLCDVYLEFTKPVLYDNYMQAEEQVR